MLFRNSKICRQNQKQGHKVHKTEDSDSYSGRKEERESQRTESSSEV